MWEIMGWEYIRKCKVCGGDFESKKKRVTICQDCNRSTYKKLWDKRDNKLFLNKFFKGQLFGKNYKLTKLDKKIIRTRVRLFKIQKKEVETDETNRI